MRWLRPEYQNPAAQPTSCQTDTQTSAQTEIELPETDRAAAAPTTGKQTWPREMREQVALIRQMVQQSPANAEQLAQHFKRKPVAAVQGVLSALEGLGLVTQAGGVYQ